MSHPLTDEMCASIWRDAKNNWLEYMRKDPTGSRCHVMRAAYDLGAQAGRDEQLDKDGVWLDNNLENYTDDPDYITTSCRHLDYLIEDLVRAMRPAAQGEES